MINYRQWQVMNESFVGTFASILSNPPTVGGPIGGIGGTQAAIDAALEEGKKKCNKKMDAGTIGDPDEDDDDEAETGDGEVVDAASEKDEDDDAEEGDDMDDETPPWLKNAKGGKDVKEGKLPPWLKKGGGKADGKGDDGDKCDDKAKKLPPWMKKGKDDDGDKDKGDDDGDKKKLPPWLKKGKGKDEAKSSSGWDPEGVQAGKVTPWLNRKGNHGSADKKTATEKLQKISDKVKKETAEAIDDLFFASLQHQAGTARTQYSDGFTPVTDDQLVSATRPEPTNESKAPQAGEVGFAPNARLFQLAGMTDDEGNSLMEPLPTLGQNPVKKK